VRSLHKAHAATRIGQVVGAANTYYAAPENDNLISEPVVQRDWLPVKIIRRLSKDSMQRFRSEFNVAEADLIAHQQISFASLP
jgi:hypothetical protein